jgi:hypothetical protein
VNKTKPWEWADLDAELELRLDPNDCAERLWVNPELPTPAARTRYRQRVELLVWFEEPARLRDGLLVVGDFFATDSVLAAVARSGGATRLLLYTATWQPIVQERYLAIRAVLRPTPMALRVAMDPAWQSLTDALHGARAVLAAERAPRPVLP